MAEDDRALSTLATSYHLRNRTWNPKRLNWARKERWSLAPLGPPRPRRASGAGTDDIWVAYLAPSRCSALRERTN